MRSAAICGCLEDDDEPSALGGDGVGLLFQPRRMSDGDDRRPRTRPLTADELLDRTLVFGAALEAVLLGDASRFNDLFTDDVEFVSPHLVVASLHGRPVGVRRARGLAQRRRAGRSRRSTPSTPR